MVITSLTKYYTCRDTDKQHDGHLENPIYDGSVVSHTITSVRDTQNIQTNEGQEVNIYDDPEANHTRRYEEFLKRNGSFGPTYAIPMKNKK